MAAVVMGLTGLQTTTLFDLCKTIAGGDEPTKAHLDLAASLANDLAGVLGEPQPFPFAAVLPEPVFTPAPVEEAVEAAADA